MDKDVIAVHLRSAEKDREGKQVSPDQMIKLANRLKRSDTVFYVLTDSEEYLEYARQNLEGPVVATSSMRVDNTVEGVHEKYAGNICLAREAIVDALIASRANTFIFTTSNLGFAVLVFNPDLRGISLRYNKAGEIECYDYAKSTDRDIFSRHNRCHCVKNR